MTGSAAVKRGLNAIDLFFRRWSDLGLVLFGIAAFLLGLWGWRLDNPAPGFPGWVDDVFRTFQLLTLQFPRDASSPHWQLNLARFLVPAIALLQSYRIVLLAIRSPARLAMLGLRFGHIILVPGKGAVGRAMLLEVQTHNLRAVAVAPDLMATERARMEDYKLPVVNADPYLDATWHQTRADRASLVVVSHGSDLDNLNIVVTVADALRSGQRGRGPTLVVTLESDTLAEQVDVALDHAALRSGLSYRRLSVPDEAARMLFLDPPLQGRKADRAQPSHIVLVGLGAAAHAVLRQAVTFGQDAACSGPTITILASEPEFAAETLLRPDGIPAYVANFRLVPCDLTSGVPGAILDTLLDDAPPVVMVCVCLADDAAAAMGIALAHEAELRKWPDFCIAVHQGREDRFLQLLAREKTASGHARLRPFGGILPTGTLLRLQNEGDDRLPWAVHEHYLETLQRIGAPGGTPMPWDDLPENIRHANRASADHIAVKLAAIDCRIVSGPAPGFAFTDAEIDDLAMMEHRRWAGERLLRGWRPGARNNDRRLHPDLKPFEVLGDDEQQKDRDAVRAIPEVLALAGLRIVRRA